ncbi:MAG: FKBP-type peptidyl-prolyl cis-trans isomerase, partial [Paramuribaculum sp.]|nr:FKBP-type peptidyl-prolyl cis-trans isomerase [Paramuribaculum sp.]
IGHLCNDLAFDSSYLLVDSVAHFQVNGVIEGWQIALNDMHVGDSAEVIIPFLQAYGSEGSGTIPPYSYLRFNMRLDDITNYETRP